MQDLPRLCAYNIQPALICSCQDMLPRRGEDSHGGRLLSILRRLLLSDVLSFGLRSSRRGRKLMSDRDLGGHIDQDRLVFEERGYEDQTTTVSKRGLQPPG